MNLGSAYIPPGLLPPTSDPKYQVAYHKLRMQYDPAYKERYRINKNAATKRWEARKK